MIDLYYWTSANAQKILLFLEEAGLPYRIIPIDVGTGAQFAPEFVRISPNSKVPVIVDHAPGGGGEPIIVFESGAILLYLAEKTGRFLSADPRERMETLQWLFWQVGGLGPMGGQASHFRNYAPEPIDYALKRYDAEVERLLGVLDRKLENGPFITGRLSIADMACYPWINSFVRRDQLDFAPFPNLARWFGSLRHRPATVRAYDRIEEVRGGPDVKDKGDLSVEERRILFGAHAA